MAIVVVLAVSMLFIPGWHGSLDYPRRCFYAVGVVLVAGTLFFRALWHGYQALWLSRAALLLFTFLAASWLSLIYATYRFEAAQIALLWTVAGILFYALVILFQVEGWVRRMFEVLTLVGLATALAGLVQTHTGWNPFEPSLRAGSLFGNPNWAAEVVNLTIAPACFLLISSQILLRRIGLSLALGAMGGFLIHTETRAVWLAIVMQSVLLGLFIARFRNHTRVKRCLTWTNAAWLSGALSVALALGATDRSGWRRAGIKKSVESVTMVFSERPGKSVSSRLAIYDNSLQLIQEHPLLGVGLYNFGTRLGETSPKNHELLFPGFFHAFEHAHNDWLQLTVELGLMFPLLACTGLFVCWERRRSLLSLDRQEGIAWHVSVIATIGYAATMIFGFPTYNTATPILLAIHLAVVERRGLCREERWPGSRWLQPLRKRPLSVLVGVAFVGLACAAGAFGVRQFEAENVRLRMLLAESENQLEEVIHLAAREGQIMPGRKEHLLHSGSASLRLATESARGRSDPEYRASMLGASAQSLRMYVKFRPNVAYAHYLLGLTLRAQGDTASAESEISTALQLFPGGADLYWERARMRMQRSEFEGALADLNAFRTNQSADASRADAMTARLLLQVDRPAEAIPILEAMAAKGPLSRPSREVLGICLLLQGNRDAEGISVLREVYASKGPDLPFRDLGQGLLLDAEKKAAAPSNGSRP